MDLELTTVPKDLYYVERKLVEDQADAIRKLRAALKPFADFADLVRAQNPGWDHDDFELRVGLSLEPFRVARVVLGPHD